MSVSAPSIIFLISQPRAGSTFLQRLLGSHPDVFTSSEPWLMLPILFGQHPDREFDWRTMDPAFSARLSRIATYEFLKTIDQNEQSYFDAAGRFGSTLYQAALKFSGRRSFLDKTPRYYYIVPELMRAFPSAKFVILLRNPLAVLHSIVTTWVLPSGSWETLNYYLGDLFDAPWLLAEAIEMLGQQGLVVRFEDLVSSATAETDRIFRFLELESRDTSGSIGKDVFPRWEFGDPTKTQNRLLPDAAVARKWEDSIGRPVFDGLYSEYLRKTSEPSWQKLGYSVSDLKSLLSQHRHLALNPIHRWRPRLLFSKRFDSPPLLAAVAGFINASPNLRKTIFDVSSD